MNIIDLFPVPVGQAELERSLTKDEMDFIHGLKNNTQQNAANIMTLNQYVLDEEPLKQLKLELESFVREYFHRVWSPKADSDIDIYITSSWLTWTGKGEGHHGHKHPNSLISGTFYVSSGPEDGIAFPNDRIHPGNIHIPFDDDKVNIYNCEHYAERASTNQVKLFPSTLRHHVNSKEDEFLRICLAFNTWVKGTIGSQNMSTELKL